MPSAGLWIAGMYLVRDIGANKTSIHRHIDTQTQTQTHNFFKKNVNDRKFSGMGTNPREMPGHFYTRALSGEVLNVFSALGLGVGTRQDNNLSIKSLSVENSLIKK